MAHFLGSIQGSSRGQATRLGHDFIKASAQGWDIGVNVYGNDEDGSDVFSIYITGGSNNPHEEIIGRVSLIGGFPEFESVKPM
jgi:hypothetical protein